LEKASPANEAEFRAWLKPGVPICIMIHGSYFPAADVAADCGQAVRWLRKGSPNVQYLCFTWPSEGIFTIQPGIAVSSLMPAVDVAILGKRAELNGIRLANFIQSLPASCPVSIVAHSHGARISASALHLLGGGTVRQTTLRHFQQRRIRAVMVAAAIDHDWLNVNDKYGRALCTTECLLNLKSSYDWALGFYPLRRLFSRTALGRTGFTQLDLMRQGQRVNKLAEIDVSHLIGAGHVFPHYYRHEGLSTALSPYIAFDK
jgi:esterase/lipase superfamily enzyme